jgi:hypothetical protein
MMHGHRPRDRAEALAGNGALQGFGALMGGEPWFVAEALALGLAAFLPAFDRFRMRCRLPSSMAPKKVTA